MYCTQEEPNKWTPSENSGWANVIRVGSVDQEGERSKVVPGSGSEVKKRKKKRKRKVKPAEHSAERRSEKTGTCYRG